MFKTNIDRRNTDSIKWDHYNDFLPTKDCLPMWVADMDFPTAPEITEAIIKRAKHPIYGYTISNESLLPPFIEWLHKRFNWDIDDKWITVTHDIVSSINFIIQNFSKIDDKVLIQPPIYSPFARGIVNNKRTLIESELVLHNKKYFIDFDDLEKKLSGNVKIMIFCSPHNPVGRVWSKEEVQKVGELCLKYNVLLLSDEIHADLVFKNHTHSCSASISEAISKNTITFFSGAKTFNIAGLKTAFVIIQNKDIREKFQAIIEKLELWGGNIFGYEALKAAYTYGDKWLEKLIPVLEDNKLIIIEFLKNNIPEIEVIDSEGTFLLWLDFRRLFPNQKELNNFIFNKAKLGLLSGTNFSKNGIGFMRMNIGCPKQTIDEALSRLLKAYKSIA